MVLGMKTTDDINLLAYEQAILALQLNSGPCPPRAAGVDLSTISGGT